MRDDKAVAVPEAVIARLEREIDLLTAATVSQVLRQLDSYASVEPTALEVSVRRNLAIAVRALRADAPPDPTELDEAEQTTRERFARGIPVEEIIRAFRISIGLIQERFVATCFAEGVPADATLAGSRLLWAVGDAFTTRVITAYHAFDLDSALQDAQRRTAYVRAMLHGRLNLAESAADLETYRIDPDASYAAVRSFVEPQTAERTRRALEAGGSLPSRSALIGVDAGECIGIVSRRPRALEDQVVGIGPFVPLREIADSFRIASRACEVASQLHRAGVHGIEDLTWRLAAVDHPEVTAFLEQRYLAPLRAEGEFGAVLEETVRVYLADGLNVARTAATLVTHTNTLRYRLRRFSELTGRSLESTEVLVELMWVLELAGDG
ncbi:MAG TPA: helix-turn-helix domain-containing protein [Nocardioidaceae bacterium]|nr:helix-turn-helix domain-containing protein [Nocardioidaceae bacterium]